MTFASSSSSTMTRNVVRSLRHRLPHTRIPRTTDNHAAQTGVNKNIRSRALVHQSLPEPVTSYHIYQAHRAIQTSRFRLDEKKDGTTPDPNASSTTSGVTPESSVPSTSTPKQPHPDVIPPTDGSYPSFADSLKRPPEGQHRGMMPGTRTQPTPDSPDAPGAPFVDRTFEKGALSDNQLPHKITDVAGDKVFESVPPQPTILGITEETFKRGFAGLAACLSIGIGLAYYYGNATEDWWNNVKEGELMLPAPITNSKSEEDSVDEMIPLSLVTDEIFDNNDHIFVFVVGDAEWLADLKIKKAMKKMMDKLGKHNPPLKFHYTVQESVKENTDMERQVKFMTYCGHRKQHFTWDHELDPDCEIRFDVRKFYEFQSMPNYPVVEVGTQTISAAQFQQFVVDESEFRPVLVQLYEETCFLCFLMRPMLQQIAKELAPSFPVNLVRINVEQNDFPEMLPMARGTPTFVLYRHGKGEKWVEFKPMDLVEKMGDTFLVDDATRTRLTDLADLVQKRFQLFTSYVMWHMELKKLEEELAHANTEEYDPDRLLERAGGGKDDGFNTMVSQLMGEDIKRTDTLDENLIHLEKEIDEVEKDVSLLGIMLGKVVEEKERRALERMGHGGSNEGERKSETGGAGSSDSSKPDSGDGKGKTGSSEQGTGSTTSSSSTSNATSQSANAKPDTSRGSWFFGKRGSTTVNNAVHSPQAAQAAAAASSNNEQVSNSATAPGSGTQSGSSSGVKTGTGGTSSSTGVDSKANNAAEKVGAGNVGGADAGAADAAEAGGGG